MISDVKIIPGCIACKNCEKICPQVFKVNGQSTVISQDTLGIEEQVLEAERMCPVQVIQISHDGGKAKRSKATLISKTMLTKDIVELIFEKPGFTCTAGQYISLFMTDKQGIFSRAYSLADTNGEKFALTIKLVPEGRGSGFLKNLSSSDNREAEYLGPHGFFTLHTTNKKKLFIGTGTGLAPLYMMMKASPKSQKKILIGASTIDDHYWVGKLKRVPNTDVSIIVSQPTRDYTGLTGRVTDYLNDAQVYEEFYLCGNPEMVDDVKKKLIHIGIENEVIFEEAYTSAVDTQPTSSLSFMGRVNRLFIGMSWGCVIAFLLWKQYDILWDISRWAVVILMSIRPLADLMPWWVSFRKTVMLRQGLGILSSIIVVTILVYTTSTSGINLVNTYTNRSERSPSGYKLFARLSEITAIILLLTSNRFSQKLLGKRWKKLHKIAYIYFYSAGIYIFSLGKIEALRSMAFVTLLYILVWYTSNRK